MHRPTHIDLGCYRIPVTWHEQFIGCEDNENVVSGEDEGNFGFLTVVGGFRIHASEKSVDEAECLMHEALHAMLRMNGASPAVLSGDEEDAVVKGLAFSIIEMLRRNPGLTEFLTKKER